MKKLTRTQRTILENLSEGRDPIMGHHAHFPRHFGAHGGWSRSFDSLRRQGCLETEYISGSLNGYRWKLSDTGVKVLEDGGFTV